MGRGTWLLLGLLSGCDRLLGLNGITPLGTASVAPWAAIAAGTSHTCGVRTDGSLWCWGDNDNGQLATATAWFAQPIQIP